MDSTKALIEELTVDEIERIILQTEPPALSDRSDKIWTRRMATKLAEVVNSRLAAALAQGEAAQPAAEGDGWIYELKAAHQQDWQAVSKQEWIRAERRAGFRPKLASDSPHYMTTCATGGFSSSGVSGRIRSASPNAASQGGADQ